MARVSRKAPSALALGLMLMTLAGQCYGQYSSQCLGDGPLKPLFYKGKCNADVEQIVFQVVKAYFDQDHDVAAGLIRLNYHDCFVRGCDASLLLDGNDTEKTAPPNLTLDGFEVIDAIKEMLEQSCPGLVSCADIIVIAARVAVFLTGGRWYNVELGRRDGLVSNATEALLELPAPSAPIPLTVNAFAKLGLDVDDFVLLLGAHTVGISHCSSFQDRMYDYNGQPGVSDPSIDPPFLSVLKKTCPQNGDGSNTIFLDQITGMKFDNKFYSAILQRKGIIQMDQEMALDSMTHDIVVRIATGTEFLDRFGNSMIKMSRVGVLTGQQGQVRKSCRAVN